MDHLIEGLMTLAQQSRAPVNREKVELSALARETVEGLKINSGKRAVRVTIQEGMTAWADPNLMRVVLENLLSNAWKFTSKNPTAHIEFGSTVINGVSTFFVRDNGAGFDMKHVDRMFTPFERFHSEEEFQGTGIGLATVLRIINKHGGKIWPESVRNQGTTFYFTVH
jgi:signal transduction histidine kinase